MRKLGMRYLLVTLLLLFYCQSAAAQGNRTLSLDINLDVGVVDRPLDLEVTVSNHSFVFIFPNTIIRPLLSQRTTTVRLPAGAQSVTAFIDEILPDPTDYVVEINCISCVDTVPQQYYRPQGNITALGDSAFIDPDDLPSQIDVSLITRAQITGQIRLVADQLAEQDLLFEVNVINEGSTSVLQSAQVTVAAGQNEVNYVIRGLNRNASQLEVLARCLDCDSIVPSVQTFSDLVSAQTDANGIDFEFDTQSQFLFNGIYFLLLSEP